LTGPPEVKREEGGLALTFARPKALPGVQYFVESPDDFTTWVPLPLELVTDGEPQTLRAHDDLSMGDPGTRVIRLRVTRDP